MAISPKYKRLTGHEIFEHLNNDTYNWGSNNQPSVYLATAILEQLPIKWIAGGGDRLQFMVDRDLTPLEHWAIEKLTPDNIQRDGWQYDLWWD